MPGPWWRHRHPVACWLVRARYAGMPMKSPLHHPATILAALGLVSGTLGSYRPRRQLRRSPRGRHLHGVRRHLVRPGDRLRGMAVGRSSLPAAALAVAGTWLAWEAAVNIGLHIDQRWLVGRPSPDRPRATSPGCRRRHRRPAHLGGGRGDDARAPPRRQASASSSRPARCSACSCRRPTNTTTRPSCCCRGRRRSRPPSGEPGRRLGAGSMLSRASGELSGLPCGCDSPAACYVARMSAREEASRHPDLRTRLQHEVADRGRARGRLPGRDRLRHLQPARGRGLVKAAAEGLPTQAIDHKGYGSREGFEAELDQALRAPASSSSPAPASCA